MDVAPILRDLVKAIAVFSVAIQCCSLSLHAQDVSPATLVAQAAIHLRGKVLPLRHLVAKSTVKYDEAGHLEGNQEPGDWTLHGQLEITDIRYTNQTLIITGNRVGLSFENSNGRPWYISTSKKAEIQIKTPKTRAFEFEKELHKAFLTATEKIPENLPAYWDRFVRCGPDPGEDCPYKLPSGVLTVGGDVREPRQKEFKRPSYSSEARDRSLEGQVKLFLVVEETGEVSYLQIEKPLGLGLDEKAVRAVQAWKFDPGTRGGSPVSVRVQVFVNFSFSSSK